MPPPFYGPPGARYRAKPTFRATMRERGQTVTGLAKALGMNRYYISDICLGEARTQIGMVRKLAELIGVAPSRLFEPAGVDGRTEYALRRDQEFRQALAEGRWRIDEATNRAVILPRRTDPDRSRP
jgi:transcriptional regulator with XRE-family HTH domain